MRQVFWVFLVLTFLFPSMPVWAQEEDEAALFQITDVMADVTASNAAHARDQAIMQAQRAAFEQLMDRLGGESKKPVDDDTVASLVQAFEVQKEQASSVRYLGTFTVQFKPNAVRAFLNKNGVVFNEVRSKPIVVLPVVASGNRKILWEDQTPWRAAWEGSARGGGMVPLIVPAGDLGDIAVISTEEALSGKGEALQALMRKYQAGGVVVAILNDLGMGQEVQLDVQLYDGMGKAGETEHLSLPSSKDVLAAAVKQVRAGLESSWRENNKAPKGPLMHLPITVPIPTLAAWTEIKTRLAQVPNVSRTNVIALQRGKADIELEFRGEIDQLQIALAQKNLVLENSPSRGWTLRDATLSQ